MYSPALAKTWLYDLFPLRHRITRRLKVPVFRSEGELSYKDPFSIASLSPAPIIQEIYEEQVLNGLDYSILPDPHEVADQQFDGGQGVQSSRMLNLPPGGLPVPILEEIPRPLENPDVLEINTAINEAAGQPAHGMEPGLEGVLGDPLTHASPMEMDLEQRLDDPLFSPLFDPLKPPGPGF